MTQDTNHSVVVFDVLIEDTRTGEKRTYKHQVERQYAYREDDGSFSDFWWSEGNASCDCNRYRFFHAYDGLSTSEERPTCGYDRFRIVSITDPDGRIVYSEPVMS